MSAPRSLWLCLPAILVAAVSTAVVYAMTGPGALKMEKESFRRPTALVDDARAENDPVWRFGHHLFFDESVSQSGRISCATCHRPDFGWSDSHPLAIGDSGETLAFKAPTLLNVGSLDRLGWTGRFADTSTVSGCSPSVRR